MLLLCRATLPQGRNRTISKTRFRFLWPRALASLSVPIHAYCESGTRPRLENRDSSSKPCGLCPASIAKGSRPVDPVSGAERV